MRIFYLFLCVFVGISTNLLLILLCAGLSWFIETRYSDEQNAYGSFYVAYKKIEDLINEIVQCCSSES